MFANLRLRTLNPRTIKAYLWHVREFTRYCGQAPDLLGEEEVRQYVHSLLDERTVSWSNMNIGYSALQFFSVDTLHRDWQVEKIPRPKGESQLPVVLSRREWKELFSATSNRKHRIIVQTIYSAGLRLSEVANRKLHHMESDSMRMRVDQGKGKRDRYTLLSETVLVEWRDYWRTYHPSSGLFFGQDKNRPISVSTMQVAFPTAKKKPAAPNPPRSIPCVTVLPPTC